jgi:hypothetical protein
MAGEGGEALNHRHVDIVSPIGFDILTITPTEGTSGA